MRNLIVTITTLLFFVGNLLGQGWKVGLSGGTAAYLGDLQEDIWNQESVHPAIGLSASYYFKDIIGIRAQGTIGHITGSDATSSESWRRARNLSFRSDLYELSLLTEIDLTGYWPHLWFHPYVFGGISVFHFNPQAQYNGEWYDLQPLGTEGQGSSAHMNRQPYSLTEIALPMGAGIRIDVGRDWQLGVEVTYRKTFTDYLDDVSLSYPNLAVLRAEHGDIAAALSDRTPEVMPDATPRATGSQRGNSLAMDTYLTGMVVLTKRLGKNIKPDDVDGVRFGCPSKF